MTTNDGGADQYIGKPLSDCPDGTVAVVLPQGADSACVRMLHAGEPVVGGRGLRGPR